MKSYQQFFAELMRRSVFKVAAVYGATAFVLLQIADLLKEGLRLPDTFIPFITAVVLLGFPLALILAWAFQMTPEGMRRTETAAPGEIDEIIRAPASKRWPAGLLALAGFVALVAGVWIAGQRSGASAALDSAGTGLVDSDVIDPDRSVRFAYLDLADDPRPSIAVLPFADMSPEGDQEYFSDGMTEEILNVLAKIQDLRVTARTSAFAFKGRNLDMRAVGDSLGVRYVVEGSVRKAGAQLRITAQLIDAADGSHMWSDSYDRTLDNVFQIQTDIAEAIAEQLRIPLGIAGPSGLVTPTADLEAYDLYLAGRAQMRERGTSLNEAIRFFEAAIARDSNWAPAWAALAEAREVRVWYQATYDENVADSVQVPPFLEASEQAALRALELDPRSASATVALGSVHRDRGEWSEAEDAYERALAFDPDNAEAYQQYAELLYNVGRVAESVRFADRAIVLDPAPIRFSILSAALQYDGRLEEAFAVTRLAMERDPDAKFGANWIRGAQEMARQGRTDEAVAAYQKALRQAEWLPAPVDTLSWWTEEAWEEWALSLAENRPPELPEDFPRFHLPRDWARVGEPDSALAEIVDGTNWVKIGLPWNPSIWDPELDSLRNDPRVRAFMATIGLNDAVLRRTPDAERTRPLILEGRAP